MKNKQAKRKIDRVTLEELLAQAKLGVTENPEVKIVRKDMKKGLSIRNCSVYDFYDAFLNIRCDTDADKSFFQEWIANCIGAMFGEEDTKKLSMGELADKISKAINAKDISDEDRWALYELCFMLTVQMGIEKDNELSLREQTTRPGKPQEHEPGSLFQRAAAWKHSQRKGTKERPDPIGRVTLEELLKTAEEKGDVLTEKSRLNLPWLRTRQFWRFCMTVKLNVNPANRDEYLEFLIMEGLFSGMVNRYIGFEFNDEKCLSEFVDTIIRTFRRKTEPICGSTDESLRLYELCYELINLMADAGSEEGHVSLMDLERADTGKDI